MRDLSSPGPAPQLTLDKPAWAIGEVSRDITGRSLRRPADGRQVSALDIQREYLAGARNFAGKSGVDGTSTRVLGLWQRAVDAIAAGNPDVIAREIDWATKYRLIERYRATHDLSLSAPQVAGATCPTMTSAGAMACTTSCSATARSSGPRATSTSSRLRPCPRTPAATGRRADPAPARPPRPWPEGGALSGRVSGPELRHHGRELVLRFTRAGLVGADYSSVLVRQHAGTRGGTAEPVSSADIEVRDLFRIGNRLG